MTSQHPHFVFNPAQTFVDLQAEAFSGFYNVAPEIKVMENTPMPSLPGDFVGTDYDSYSNVASNPLSYAISDDELLITPIPPTLGPLPSSEQGINPIVLSRNPSTSPSSAYHTPLEDPLSLIDLPQYFSSQFAAQGNQATILPQDLIPMYSGDAASLHTSPNQSTISPNALHSSNHLTSSAPFFVAPAALHPAHPLSRVSSPTPSFRTAPATLSRPGSAYSARSVQSFHSQRPSLQLSASFASHSVVEPGRSTFPAVNLPPLVINEHARVTAPTLASPTPQRINPASAPFAFPPQLDASVNAGATLLSSMGPYPATIDPAAIVSPRIARHTRFGSAPTSASYSPMHGATLVTADNGLPAHESLILASRSSSIAYSQSMLLGDALRTTRRSVSPTARSSYHHSEIEESGSSAGSPFTPFAHTRNASIVSASIPVNYFSNTFNGAESIGSSQQAPGGIDPSLLSAQSACATSSPSTRHSTPWSEFAQYSVEQSEALGSYYPAVPALQTTSKRMAAPRKTKQQPAESRTVNAEYTDDEYINGQDTDDDYDGDDKKRKRGKSASGANKRRKTTGSEDQSDAESAQISKMMKRKFDTLPKLTSDMRSCPVCHFVPSNKRFSDVQRHYQSHFKEGAKDKRIYVCTLCGDVEHDPVTMQRVYNNRPGHPKSVTTVYTRKDSVKRHWNSYHKPTDPNWQEDYITTVDAVHPDAAGAKKKSARQGEEAIDEWSLGDSSVSFPLSV